MSRLAIAVALLISFVSFSAHANDETFKRVMANKAINCGYFIWIPNIQKDPNTGKLSGANFDVMEAVGRTLKLKINWVAEIGPADVATALASNKIDAMCATMWPSPDRYSDTIYATRPQFYSLMFPIVRADDKRFDNGFAGLDNKSIRVTGFDGDTTADVAREKLPNATPAFLGPMASPAEALMQLTTKKADVLFLDKGAINEFSKANPGLLKVVDKNGPVRIFGEYNMYKPGEERLRDMIDMAIAQLVNDGLMEEIAKKYSERFQTTIHAPAKTIAP